jgi:hypothetical protein
MVLRAFGPRGDGVREVRALYAVILTDGGCNDPFTIIDYFSAKNETLENIPQISKFKNTVL